MFCSFVFFSFFLILSLSFPSCLFFFFACVFSFFFVSSFLLSLSLHFYNFYIFYISYISYISCISYISHISDIFTFFTFFYLFLTHKLVVMTPAHPPDRTTFL